MDCTAGIGQAGVSTGAGWICGHDSDDPDASIASRQAQAYARPRAAHELPVSYFNPFTFALQPLRPGSPMGAAILGMGFRTFEALAAHVRQLPYARTTWPDDPLAVLREGRGTCSSKHQLLATVAQECGHPEVVLTVGVYEMTEANTPGVGAALRAAGYTSIPEAHCYLTVDHQRWDFTGLPRGIESPFQALIEEHFLLPESASARKRTLHQQALGRWAERVGVSSIDAWAVREACIAALSNLSD